MRKAEREPCAFCPETADITGEHIWSAWAERQFGTGKYLFVRKEIDGNVRSFTLSHLSPKTKVVCGKCNNGWMSDLENLVSSIIGDMVRDGSPRILNAKDIATIARWAFTKAIVAEHSHHNREPFWSFSERQSFRRTLSIPQGVQMWLAAFALRHGLFKSYSVQTPLNTPYRFQLNVFTYGLGNFIVQVVAARWAKKAYRRHRHPPTVTQNTMWDTFSIPIWPSDVIPVGWPPPGHLADNAIEQFVQRWTNLERR